MVKEYTIQVKLSNEKTVTYHSVHDLVKFCRFLDGRFNGTSNDKWLFCNVYDKRTRERLGNYVNGKYPTRPIWKTEL